MTPQQQIVLDCLLKARGWIKGADIVEKTAVKAPRTIVMQLRERGHDIYSHRAGPRSRGYCLAEFATTN